jgi:ribosome-associated protein
MAVKKTQTKSKKEVKAKPVKKTSAKDKTLANTGSKVSSKATKTTKSETKLKQKSLVDVIVAAMDDKKAQQIVSLDLRNIESASADYFVIAHANNTTQVDAIASNVEDEVKKQLKEKVLHSEGYQNCEWILLDYFNVVVHVFLEEKRSFYRLEQMWADAITKTY